MEILKVKTSELFISPEKLNLVASLVRRKNLDYSINLLSFVPKKGGRIIKKLLTGAKKNIEKNNEKSDNFFIYSLEIGRGRIQKRIIFRAKGRADRIRRRYSLISLRVARKNLTSDS